MFMRYNYYLVSQLMTVLKDDKTIHISKKLALNVSRSKKNTYRQTYILSNGIDKQIFKIYYCKTACS